MYSKGMKGNETSDGEERFPRSPGSDNGEAESQELNSLDTITGKRSTEYPLLELGKGSSFSFSRLVPGWVIGWAIANVRKNGGQASPGQVLRELMVT